MATRKRTKAKTVAEKIAELPFQEDFLFYKWYRWVVGYKYQEDIDSYSISYYGDASSDISLGRLYIYKGYEDEDQEFTHIAKLPSAPKGG